MDLNRREFVGALTTSTVLLAAPRVLRAQDAENVIIWVQSGPEAEALKAVASAYTNATGKPVTIGVQGRDGWALRYETALAAGSKEFDGLLHISRNVPVLAAGGLIHPLDDFIKKSSDYKADDFSDIVISEMSYDGRAFMAPTDIVLETLVYRTDLIQSKPASWTELRDNALNFTKALNPDSATNYGYAYTGVKGNLLGSFLGIMGSYGAEVIDAQGCVKVDSPQMKEAWSLFINLKNVDKVTPPDINAWDYPQLLLGLQNGTLAQASFFTAGMPILLDCAQTPDQCHNLALVAQPAGPAGSRTRVVILGIMMNAASERKEATWEFIKYATGQEGSMIYTKAGGQGPRQSILRDQGLGAERPWLPEVLKASNAGVGSLRIAQTREVREAFDRHAQQALAGQMSPEESLDRAAADIRSIMGNEGKCG